MTGYDWIAIDAPDDYDELTNKIAEEYAPEEVVKQLKFAIRETVRGVLIERGYIDKDYRSTFYHYYAKKGRKYGENCVRLHFFEAGVSFDEARNDLLLDGHLVEYEEGEGDKRLEVHYYGYVVLRPTIAATIGRSILTPDIRAGARGHAIQAKHRVHVLGHQLSVWGFPSMSQHTDISVCAHVSCWAILRHYSERFSQYRELLLHEVTMLATQYDPGGITPGLGLKAYEAERILHAAGTYPILIGKQVDKDELFYAQLLAYLESGFPLFCVMEGREHAVVLNGYGWRNPPACAPHPSSHAIDQVEHFLAIDDHHLPYACVSTDELVAATARQAALENGTEAAPSGEPGVALYSTIEFDGFVVPLPDKIHYPASAVEKQSLAFYAKWLRDWLGLCDKEDLLRRYFITTVSALRRYARSRRSELGEDLVNMIMLLDTAQFVWIVEYASSEEWATSHISARVIIDATASPRDPMPVVFAHGRKKAVAFDRSKAAVEYDPVELSRDAGQALSRMEQNLRRVRQLERAKA